MMINFRILLVLFALLPGFSQANWDQASGVVDRLTGNMLQIVANPDFKEPENIDQLMAEIDQVIGQNVDFDYIGKSVMGKYVRRASDDEVSRFADVFRRTLLRTYAKAIVGFEFEKYVVVPPAAESPEPDKQIVNVDVTAADGKVYSLVYYMTLEDQNWMLVNALVDGINLRITFRNQFASLMEEHSTITKVIDHWDQAMSGE